MILWMCMIGLEILPRIQLGFNVLYRLKRVKNNQNLINGPALFLFQSRLI